MRKPSVPMIAILLSSSVGMSIEGLTGVSQVLGLHPDVFSCELEIAFFFFFFLEMKVKKAPQENDHGWYMAGCHYCSRSFFFFFFSLSFFPPRFCPGHIPETVTRRDSRLNVLLGPAV